MIQKPAFTILSAERPSLPATVNRQRTKMLKRQLRRAGIAAIPVTGRFHGTAEHSVLVFDVDDTTVETLNRLARVYEQDAVLRIDGSRRAYLEDPVTGKAVSELGAFRAVSPERAAELDSVTELNGQHYAVEAA